MKAIAAVARNGVIGADGKIPWRLRGELEHFKETTMGGIVLMGRRTWEGLAVRPLPGRENAVLTSRPGEIRGAAVFSSLEEALRRYGDDPRQTWICGGAELYRAALPLCSEIILSRVDASPEGDAFFPGIEGDFKFAGILLRGKGFDVARYIRR